MKISLRAQELLKNPKYCFDKNDKKSVNNVYITISSDNKLTVNYQIQESILVNLCLEVLSILLHKRSPKRLFDITFKEFENFLRDENGIATFDSDTQSKAENVFIQTKYLLLGSWPWDEREPLFLNKSKSYIDKLRFINSLFIEANSQFELNSDFKLVHFEYEFIYFTSKSEHSLDILIHSIENYLSLKLQTPMKLVAVRT